MTKCYLNLASKNIAVYMVSSILSLIIGLIAAFSFKFGNLGKIDFSNLEEVYNALVMTIKVLPIIITSSMMFAANEANVKYNQVGFQRFLRSTPLSSIQLVLPKYLTSLILCLITIVISLVYTLILSTINNDFANIITTKLSIMFIFGLYSLSVLLHLLIDTFKSMEKSMVALLVSVGVLFSPVIIKNILNPNPQIEFNATLAKITSFDMIVFIIAFVLTAICISISCLLRRRDL